VTLKPNQSTASAAITNNHFFISVSVSLDLGSYCP
jgi:hypothetical protein